MGSLTFYKCVQLLEYIFPFLSSSSSVILLTYVSFSIVQNQFLKSFLYIVIIAIYLEYQSKTRFLLSSYIQCLQFYILAIYLKVAVTIFTLLEFLLRIWFCFFFVVSLFVCFTDERTDTKVSEAIWVPEEHYSSSPEKILSPFSQRFQACRANLQTTSKLSLSSEMVYSKELDLPEGVEIISVQPSAGLYIPQRLSQLCKTWLLTVFLKVDAVTYS